MSEGEEEEEAKYCFIDRTRPCNLTCKAAFEVDDPVDNVDCYFIWLAHHLGESLFDVKRVLEGLPGFPGTGGGAGGFPGAKGPKGSPSDN